MALYADNPLLPSHIVTLSKKKKTINKWNVEEKTSTDDRSGIMTDCKYVDLDGLYDPKFKEKKYIVEF